MKIKDLGVIARETAGPMVKAGLACLGGGALLSIALSLGQCSNNGYSLSKGYVDNHTAEAGIDPIARKVIIHAQPWDIDYSVGGIDIKPYNWGFDTLTVRGLPEDHPFVKKFKNKQVLEDAYTQLTGERVGREEDN